MALPVFRAASAKASGTGAVTPALPAGVQANDIVVLTATTIAGGSLSITANGSIATWTLVSAAVDVASGEKLYVWWGRYTSGSTGPTVTPGSDHCCAGTAAFSGCRTDTTPIEAVATGTEVTSDTSYSFATGVSTSDVDRLVLCAYSSGADSNSSQGGTPANTSLTALASRMDFCTNSGGGGGFTLAEGAKAAAGTCGTWTATMGTATPKAYINFALMPVTTQAVTAPAISSGSSLFAASLAYAVTAAAIASGSALFAPTVAPDAPADQNVTAPAIASTVALSAPTLVYVVQPPAIASGSSLAAPSLAAVYDLTGATITSGAIVSAPSVAQEIAAPSIGGGAMLQAPSLVMVGAIRESFTDADDTLLKNHVSSDDGTTWRKHPVQAGELVIRSNRVRLNTNDTCLFVANTVMPSGDYSVFADLIVTADGAGARSGVIARWAESINEGVLLRYNITGGSEVLDLFDVVSGSFTVVDSYSTVLGAGTYRLELRLSGTMATGLIDGVQRVSATITPTGIGRVGLRLNGIASPNDSNGLQIDNFNAAVSQSLSLPAIASGASVPAPTLAHEVDPPAIPSSSSTAAPATAYAATAPAIASGATLAAPAVAPEVNPPAIDPASSLAAPTLAYAAEPPAIASGAALHAPSVGAAGTILGATIASATELYAPAVVADQILALPSISSGATIFAPATSGSAELAAIPSTAAVHPPSLAAAVALPTVPSGSVLYGPAVSEPAAQEVALPTIASGAVVRAPSALASAPPNWPGRLGLELEPSGCSLELADSQTSVAMDASCTKAETDGGDEPMAGSNFYIKQGNLLPPLRARLRRPDGGWQDLTGLEVAVRLGRPGGTLLFERPVIVEEPGSSSWVRYDWQEGDTDVPGAYPAEFVTTIDGKPYTFPNYHRTTVWISRRVG